jgi:hypothetical protein
LIEGVYMKLFLTAVVALVSLLPVTLSAKEGPAILAVIDQVTVESGNSTPDVIRISGTFLVPRPIPHKVGDSYLEPQRGYLLFRVVLGMGPAVERDVAQLKMVAGTGSVVGFGDYWMLAPYDANRWPSEVHVPREIHVHKETETATPEWYYPNSRGVVKTADSPDPRSREYADRLLDFLNLR